MVFLFLSFLFIYLFYHINILKMKFSREFRMFSQKSPFFIMSVVYYIQISTTQKHTHPTKSKRPKLQHILPSSPRSNAGSRSACSPGFAACSFGFNDFYFISFIYVIFLNFHNTLPSAPNRNRRQFFLSFSIRV